MQGVTHYFCRLYLKVASRSLWSESEALDAKRREAMSSQEPGDIEFSKQKSKLGEEPENERSPLQKTKVAKATKEPPEEPMEEQNSRIPRAPRVQSQSASESSSSQSNPSQLNLKSESTSAENQIDSSKNSNTDVTIPRLKKRKSA
jgi:hypothetical protein